ncbi:hypothetical protein AQUCO_01300827v1 [Aquilegia coerulea]|uniref:RRM domain-containing protein n=1 Tax=Aquilegia coerulea TaxID=218851 RepID=A0A2G5E3L5_AQUCA|nr:hypothetical protein AQUCO_01300827v1 [Aquilegia coerulea]
MMVCSCCEERMCYLQSFFDGRSPIGIAILKFCSHCQSLLDHEAPMCPLLFKDAFCHDGIFDPLKHCSFYVLNLPKGVTEVDLYAHFRGEDDPLFEDVVVHHDKETDECFGYLQFDDPVRAAKALEWGNGTGSLFGKDGVNIKCLPSKIHFG